MANPSGDVYEDIAEIYRRLDDLATSARVPQLTQNEARLQALADDTGVTGSLPNSWGDIVGGGVNGLTIAARVPASGRILISHGAYIGAKTNATTFGTWDLVSMGVLVNGATDEVTPPATTIHQPQYNSANLYIEGTTSVAVRQQANIATSIVIDASGFTRVQVDTQFMRQNLQSAATYVQGCWLHVQPV